MLTVPDSIKDLLHLDSCKKNIRIHFPNGEREDICNDLIVKDSVSFTESLCSQNTLKFGLCEAPMFECELVGVSNVTGATIEVFCEIYCDSTVSGAEWKLDLEAWVYSIQYGTFVVSDCKRQADMIHRRLVAYGGSASYNWGMSAIEAGKYYEGTTSNITYTPHVLYFCNANNIELSDELYDITPKTYSKSSVSGGGGTDPYMETGYTIEYDGECYSNYIYSADAESIFEIDATANDFKDELFVFLKEYGHILPQYFDMKYEGYVKTSSLRASYYAYNNTFINATIWDSTTEKPPFYFHPYITGLFSNANCRFDWFMPLWVTFKVKYNGNVIHSKTITFYSDVTFKIKKLKSWLPEIRLSFPRSKRGSYYDLFFKDVDIQEILASYLELCGLFGVFDRENKITFVDIKQQFNLLPDSNLYPNSSLKPQGVTGGKLLPQDYQSCWYDDYYTLPYGKVICAYKDSSNVDNVYQYYLTGYDDTTPVTSYRTYDLSDNSLIKSKTWTSTQIGDICQQVATSLNGVTYIPVEFTGRGLPYVEPGDTFEILTKSNDSITTIVLNRTLSGEMVLTDSYKSV